MKAMEWQAKRHDAHKVMHLSDLHSVYYVWGEGAAVRDRSPERVPTDNPLLQQQRDAVRRHYEEGVYGEIDHSHGDGVFGKLASGIAAVLAPRDVPNNAKTLQPWQLATRI